MNYLSAEDRRRLRYKAKWQHHWGWLVRLNRIVLDYEIREWCTANLTGPWDTTIVYKGDAECIVSDAGNRQYRIEGQPYVRFSSKRDMALFLITWSH